MSSAQHKLLYSIYRPYSYYSPIAKLLRPKILPKMKKRKSKRAKIKLPKKTKEDGNRENNHNTDGVNADELEKDSEDEGGSKRSGINYGSNLVQGKMDHGMEDYIVTEERRVDGHTLGLFAIFDGHSGRDVAEYLQSHLFDNILNQTDFWEDPEGAIRSAYKATDDEILARKVRRGGSTAVTALLIDGLKLIVANVGDSRAVICRNGSARPITVDHDAEREKELVERKGGFVVEMPGNVPRVDGQLAMSRAFGDSKLKEHITSEPDIRILTIDKKTEFTILASDGLWKVMSNQEACECIREMAMDPQKASEELIKEALSKKSSDDISCIVVTFH